MSESVVWQADLPGSHPAAHGPVSFRVAQTDGVIIGVQPQIAHLHRGVEKLLESRDLRQGVMLADRHDWHSAFSSELGFAQTIEQALGIVITERAKWIRTALAELNRCIHHLRWLAANITGYEQELTDELIERAVGITEQATGGRLHPMAVQVGGMRVDLADDLLADLADLTADISRQAAALIEVVGTDDRWRGRGLISAADTVTFGGTGPIARASGSAVDQRFLTPYAGYGELISDGILTVVSRPVDYGDATTRLLVLVEELTVAALCLRESVERVDANPGPIQVRVPRTLRLPEGEHWSATENPTGMNGWLMVSRGDNEPYRVVLRTASFANAQLIAHAAVGQTLADLHALLATGLLVSGDIGK